MISPSAIIYLHVLSFLQEELAINMNETLDLSELTDNKVIKHI